MAKVISLILFVFLSVLMLSIVNAQDTCEGDSDCFGGQICHIPRNQCLPICEVLEIGGIFTDCEELSEGLCSADDLLFCAEGNLLRAIDSSTGQVDLFCFINGESLFPSTIPCANSCSEGSCQEQICIPNTEFCSTEDIVIDEEVVATENAVVKCSSDGKSLFVVQDCEASDRSCVEGAGLTARCESGDTWFCTSNNIECFTSDVFIADKCSETLEGCKNGIPVYCLSSDKEKCVKRSGSCLPGEFSFKGTQPGDVKATCEGQRDRDFFEKILDSISDFFNQFRLIIAIVVGLLSGIMGGLLWKRLEEKLKVKSHKSIPFIAAIIIGIALGIITFKIFYVALIILVLFFIVKIFI